MNPAALGTQPIAPSDVGTIVRRIVEGDVRLRDVLVRGEVTSYSPQPSGRIYFSLKDGAAVLSCIAWEDAAAGMPAFKNGSGIVARGRVTVYAGKSTYQLVVQSAVLDGVGDLHAVLEARKRKLAAEGLFASDRKRPIPAHPFRVALVSSRSARGAIDFVKILRKRAPHVAIRWCETQVQGAQAGAQIAGAIAHASRLDVDCIVITRGGGSFEDMFCFSDEAVVRAIAGARHPVISAVGHAIDRQLSDFVADRYAETPTDAANMIGSDTADLVRLIEATRSKLTRTLARGVDDRRLRLERVTRRSQLDGTERIFADRRQRIDDLRSDLDRAAAANVRRRADRLRAAGDRLHRGDPSVRVASDRQNVASVAGRLDAAVETALVRARDRTSRAAERLGFGVARAYAASRQRAMLLGAQLEGKDPEAILKRGYAIVSFDGAIVRDPKEVAPGSLVEAKLARGILRARVEE